MAVTQSYSKKKHLIIFFSPHLEPGCLGLELYLSDPRPAVFVLVD